MSQITVQMYGTLREKVGKGKISINAENIKDALEKLANQFARKFRVQLYEKGEIKSHYILLLNGHVVNLKQEGQIKLSPGDILYIFSPIAGG